MNPMMMINQFPAFMQRMRGQNPQAILQNMISSGQISQQQLDQAQQIAQQMQGQLDQFRGMFGFGGGGR